MGLLVNGNWSDQWYDTKSSKGRFVRQESQFRNWVTADGSPGPTGKGGFSADSGRYHLYVSLACPWAHRTLIFRKLKDLEPHISVSVVEPLMPDGTGWQFAEGGDELYGLKFMHEIYTKAVPDVTTRVTVPVLWDQEQKTIVSNESSEIIRMFNSAFNRLTGNTEDYYPEELRGEIDAMNERVYAAINNGVYRCGFATEQEAYEEACHDLFRMLDELEVLLGKQRYLVGGSITEADWRLFTTLIRFDAVYVGHFKCNRSRIADFEHLSGYLCELYQHPGVAETVNFNHIKHHYYASHKTINPTGVVPVGPVLDLERSHGRGR